MEHLIAWAGFLGAWLLVAGPVYQAALELRQVQEWESTPFWVLLVLMLLLTLGFTVFRMRRSADLAKRVD